MISGTPDPDAGDRAFLLGSATARYCRPINEVWRNGGGYAGECRLGALTRGVAALRFRGATHYACWSIPDDLPRGFVGIWRLVDEGFAHNMMFLDSAGIENAFASAWSARRNARQAAVCAPVDRLRSTTPARQPYNDRSAARKYLEAPAGSSLFTLRRHRRSRGRQDVLRCAQACQTTGQVIGDTRSLCCHPASTTDRQMTPEEQRRAGVTPETIRLSIGIEHVGDILEDLDQALLRASPAARRRESRQRSDLKAHSTGDLAS